jgi:hypothetical protein
MLGRHNDVVCGENQLVSTSQRKRNSQTREGKIIFHQKEIHKQTVVAQSLKVRRQGSDPVRHPRWLVIGTRNNKSRLTVGSSDLLGKG